MLGLVSKLMQENRERWMELVELAEKEQDTKTLLEIINELSSF
jgi:hypothetical protein